MGDLCVDEDITEIPSTWHASSKYCLLDRQGNQAHGDVASHPSLLVDSYGFCSLVDDIFTCLVTLAAYLSHQLICFVEDLVVQDINGCSKNAVACTSGSHSRYSSFNICKLDGDGFSSSPKCYINDTSSGIRRRRASDAQEDLLVNKKYGIVETSYSHQGVSVIIEGLKSRVHRTLLGSSDDIGWLQRTPGMAPVEDGTIRFLEILENIRNGQHTLPNSFVYLLIPGLFSNLATLYFVGTKRSFSKMGLACHIAELHSEAPVEQNACELKHYIEELYWGYGKRVMLLGHSKGGVDAAASLSFYWSDLKNKVAGLAFVQCPYGGSPMASDFLREGQIADKEIRKIMEFVICKILKGDIRALEDLTYDKRMDFILKHKLPEHIPLISFHTEASIGPGVLATMTQIAHAELPWLPLPKIGVEEPGVFQVGRQVPLVLPISAVMAVCALHMQLRYGEKSDGMVTRRDAEVPGSVVVRPDRKLNHAWMVYSSRKKNPNEPDCNDMCEALLTMLVELHRIKGKK